MKKITRIAWRTTILTLIAIAFVIPAQAQKATVSIGLDEPFFDALLDAVFQNFGPPEFAVATIEAGKPPNPTVQSFGPTAPCSQTVKILREMNGVRTAVKFRDSRIVVPIAFSGNYSAPFIGCVEFAGIADATLDLEFDARTQRLIGRARVLNVNLNGTGGVGGTIVARMIQTSIDRKLNPIEILSLEKLSFAVPIRDSGDLRLRAVGARPVMGSGVIHVNIDYVFSKG